MDNQKFQIILDSLLKGSEAGNLEWKPTAISNVYLLALKDSSISIIKLAEGFIKLEFRNERGSIAEEVEVYGSEYATAQENYIKANKLFDLARRKATNADETIDRILKQLNPDSIAA
ncbi:MAG: hypothetical protein M3R11_05650 [Acidobacteriota bacterium]|nr:hypothetical protein [Acidobacteriota bacterium]